MLFFCNTSIDFPSTFVYNTLLMSVPNNRQSDSLSSNIADSVKNPAVESSQISPCSHEGGFAGLGASVVSSLSVGVVAFGPDLRVIDANSQARKLIKVGESIGKSLEDGTDSNIWQNWSGVLRTVVSTGKKGQFESVRYLFDGRSRLLDLLCSPLVDSSTGRSIGGALMIEDVTDKVEIANQLAQTERFAAMGKIAGQVAHELNNPMDGILRYIGLAVKSIEREDLEKPKEYLEHCRVGLLRMAQIITKLLEFSRNTYSSFEYTTVDKVVEDAVRSMEGRAFDVQIEIIRDYEGDLQKIRGGNLFQVFSNLIKNGLDAMEGAGSLVITIGSLEDVISVSFTDTGCGFPPDKAEMMFEPFFTTKGVGSGTGLGLAICKDLIEKYEGTITAVNNKDGGSTFTVTLPIMGLASG